jgi:hypothetical protein
MDAELKEFLEHSEQHNEMSKGFEEMNRSFDKMDARPDHKSSRLEKQGGLIQGGALSLRMIQWSEDTDSTLTKVLLRLGTVEQRLDKLEGNH